MKFRIRTLGFTSQVMTRILGLLDEAVVGVIVGFLRKDVGVGMLAPLGLSVKQLIVGCATLAMFFPCIATFTLLFKELGLVDTLKSVAVTVVTALTVGGCLIYCFKVSGCSLCICKHMGCLGIGAQSRGSL